MLEISYDHAIPDPGSGRAGFAQTLRDMRKGGSVEIPLTKKPGVYAAARAAGVKVRMRTTDKGTVRVWRLDEDPKPFSLDEIRDIYQVYLKSHSSDQAFEILRPFGCGGITEAHERLDPAAMRLLVGKLRDGFSSPTTGSIFK